MRKKNNKKNDEEKNRFVFSKTQQSVEISGAELNLIGTLISLISLSVSLRVFAETAVTLTPATDEEHHMGLSFKALVHSTHTPPHFKPLTTHPEVTLDAVSYTHLTLPTRRTV